MSVLLEYINLFNNFQQVLIMMIPAVSFSVADLTISSSLLIRTTPLNSINYFCGHTIILKLHGIILLF